MHKLISMFRNMESKFRALCKEVDTKLANISNFQVIYSKTNVCLEKGIKREKTLKYIVDS